MTDLAINCSYQMYMVFRSHSHMHVIMMTHCNVLVLSKVASIPWFWWSTWSLWSVLLLGWVAPRLKQYAKDSSESKWVSEDQLQSDLLESSWDLKPCLALSISALWIPWPHHGCTNQHHLTNVLEWVIYLVIRNATSVRCVAWIQVNSICSKNVQLLQLSDLRYLVYTSLQHLITGKYLQ